MDVSDMLLASVSLHRSAATAKSESKLELWRHAYEMRKRAHAEDPDHLSPGWAAEQGECKELQTGATMTSATFAQSEPKPGVAVWDMEIHNSDPANFASGTAPSGGPTNGTVEISTAGTYLIQASVLVKRGQEGYSEPNLPPADIDVDLYVHEALGYPTGRVDSARVTLGPNGWASVKLGGTYVLPEGGGPVIVQTDPAAWIHGDPDPRWTSLSVVKLSD